MLTIWTADQDRGRRDYQEDFFAVVAQNVCHYRGERTEFPRGTFADGQCLFVMADGMGGMGHGDLAASTIVERYVQAFAVAQSAGHPPQYCLRTAAEAANSAVADLVIEDFTKNGMGATLIAVFWDISQRSAYWLSIGDSVLARYRGGEISRLNQQHTLRWLVEQRRAVGQDVEGWDLEAQGNALCSAVSGTPLEIVDQSQEALLLLPGDTLLIASDGLETLSDGKIAQVLRDNLAPDATTSATQPPSVEQLNSALSALMATIEDYDLVYQDNSTVLLVSMSEADVALQQSG